MRIDDLVLFATNTGDFYDEQCKMARIGAHISLWHDFVRSRVIPRYRRELHEPFDGMALHDIAEVAAQLRDYYAEHVHESQSCR